MMLIAVAGDPGKIGHAVFRFFVVRLAALRSTDAASR
jgi:hypothetical protein